MPSSFSSFIGRRAGLTASLILSLLLSPGLAASAQVAAKPTERSKQKAQAEADRAGLQQKLSDLKRDIGKTESAKDDAADTLADSEVAISNANRALFDLKAEQGQTGVKLEQLNAEHAKLLATVELQKAQLSKLLREQYVAGNEDRIKLLLSGDDPNRINRELQMLAYVSQAQARLLTSLRTNLQAVETNQTATQSARDDLDEIAQEQTQQKTVLEQQKAHHAALLASLSQRLVAQRKEAGNVERDEQRMAGLVDKLGKLIKEQAEAAAAEKRRQEQLAQARAQARAEAAALAKSQAQARATAKAAADAQARAERERLAREQKGGKIKPQAPFKPEPIDADEAPKLAVAPSAPTPAPAPAPPIAKPQEPVHEDAAKPAEVSLAPAAADGAFASLRGQMRAPIAGKIAARFGSKRGDGPAWKGVFIRAAEGSDVKAIAGGRVVFAEWLRGFGNLIIVDHGGEYMSIYGNNQTLLKRAGDVVKAGDSIANAGNSGGNEESGLYFELRHQGRAFDPAGWVKF